MRVTYCDSPTPHLLLEDVYTSNQLNIIWEEIDSLQKHLLLPDKTGSAFEFGGGTVSGSFIGDGSGLT